MTMQLTARLAGLLWAASFFLSLGYLPSAEPERLAAVVLGIAALSLLAAGGGEWHRRVMAAPRVALPVLLFWVLAMISTAWSVAPATSLIYLGSFTLLPATILAVLFATEEMRRGFLRYAVIGAALAIAGTSLWAVAQIFLLTDSLVSGQVRHPFANPNAFAALLSLSFFAGLGLFLTAAGQRQRIILWAGLLFILCAFGAAAPGKASTLAMAVGLVLMIILTRGLFPRLHWKMLLMLASAVFTITALMPNPKNSVSVVFGLVTGETGSLQNRLDIWGATFDLIAANPWLGSGYRTFSLMYSSVRPDSDLYSSGFMVHSDPLQFWAEMGILGPILFYAVGIAVLWRCITWWRRQGPVTKDSLVPLSLFLGCAAFIAHSHVDFHFYTLPTAMLFALALSVLLVKTGPENHQAVPFNFMAEWPETLRLLAVLGPLLGIIGLHGFLMMGEYYTSKASRQIRNGDIGGFTASVNTAHEIGFGMNARPFLMAATVPLSILKSRYPALTLQEQQMLFDQTNGLIEKALMRNSRLAAAWHHRGDMLLHLDGKAVPPDYWSAEESFSMALKIDPLNLHPRLALAGIYEAAGKKREAFDLLMDGVHWPYPVTDPAPLFDRALALALSLAEPKAITQIEAARLFHDQRVDDARRRHKAMERAKDNNLFIP